MINIDQATQGDIFKLLQGPLGYTDKHLAEEINFNTLLYTTQQVMKEMEVKGYVLLKIGSPR